MYIGKKKNPMQSLEKKIPRNPKYAHVKGHLDTGNTVPKMKTISTKQFIQRRSELFKRIRPSSLASLIHAEVLTHIECTNNQLEEGQIEKNQRVEDGVGGLLQHKNLHVQDTATTKVDPSIRSFLLLDVRVQEEYKKCNIHGAISYELSQIHQDRFIPELYRFKNKEGKIIVVYDEDERIASRAARELLEKGYENVRMLSYGLKGIGNNHPECIQGELPSHLIRLKSPSPSHRSHRSSALSVISTPRDNSTCAGSVSNFSVFSSKSRMSFSRAPRFSLDKQSKIKHKERMDRILGGTDR